MLISFITASHFSSVVVSNRLGIADWTISAAGYARGSEDFVLKRVSIQVGVRRGRYITVTLRFLCDTPVSNFGLWLVSPQ